MKKSSVLTAFMISGALFAGGAGQNHFLIVTCWALTGKRQGRATRDVFAEIQDDSIWQEIHPVAGAPEVLKKWIDEGHRVYVVTDTPYQSIRSKMDNLLFRCFPYLTWNNVVITSNKQLLHGDVMIDDGIHNLVGGSYRKLLFDAPYNRDVDEEKYELTRVSNWQEIDSIVTGLSRDIG